MLQKVYVKDKVVTWQSCSSSGRSQIYVHVFVGTPPGRKLSGLLFVILPCVAKQIEMFLEFLAEQEIVFLPCDVWR